MEQLYSGGEIYTVDPAHPSPEAVAVRDGKIVKVGSCAECEQALSRFESIDLGGRTLLPGFIDTHLHPTLIVFFDMNVDLRRARTFDEITAKMRTAAKEGEKGAWTFGLDFDEQNLDDPRMPTRHDLDRACPDQPALILKHDGHSLVANTKAIQAASISSATADPEGGVIDREGDGFPSGVFRENAKELILSAVPFPDLPQLMDGAKTSFERLASFGITSIGAVLQTDEEGPASASGAYDMMALELFLDHLPVSVYGLLIARSEERVEEALRSRIHTNEPGGHRIGCLKIFADGTFGSCTAYMNQPFSDHPETSGFLVHSREEIYRRMVMAQSAGLQIAIHAIGDAASKTCVELYARLLKEYPKQDHRHRLEHASQLDASLIRDMARLGIVVSTQPLFIQSEKHWLEKRLGPERLRWTYPYRSLLDAGVKVAGASDAPVESLDVLDAIQCAVTRKGFVPDQGVSVEEAIRMFTMDAAYAQFEEAVKGSISVGKRADFVILSGNPVKLPVEQIGELRVQRTIRAGQTTFERTDF